MTGESRGWSVLARLLPALYVVGVVLIAVALAMYSLPLGLLALGAFCVGTVVFEVYG